MRSLVAVCVTITVAATAGSPAAEVVAVPKPTTVVTARSLGALAQDGEWIVWADTDSRFVRGTIVGCPAVIRVRNLRTKATRTLSAGRGQCEGFANDPSLQGRMALAGTRALWGKVYLYNYEHTIAVVTGVPSVRERAVGWVERNGGRADDPPFTFVPVPMAGDGKALAYVDQSNNERTPAGVVRVVGPRAIPLQGSERAHEVAVSGDTLAYAERSLGTCGCDSVVLASWSSGTTQSRFELPTGNRVRRLAVDGSRLVLLVGPRLEIRTTSGRLVRTIPVPRAAPEIDLAGGRLVYRVGRTIRLVDLRSGAVSKLAQANGTVIGLSIEGRRVMWGESTRRRARIVQVVLAR